MRVLHLNAGNLYGGVESFLVTLARFHSLAPDMHQEFGLCYPDGRYAAELATARARTHSLGAVRFSRPWSVWSARRHLHQLLDRERFDVGLCHMSWSHAVFGPVLAARGVPVVHWAHGAMAGKHWVERRASRIPPRIVICNSRFTAQSAPNLFSAAPTKVVHCPVALSNRQDRSSRLSLRAEFGTSPESVVIVQVSRMERWKGHEDLLRALGKLSHLPSWTCWLVGGAQRPAEFEYVSQLRELAATLGIGERVRFLGTRSDVPAILSAADIFCQPNSEPEPFGIVFIEALAAGLPVVTTDMGGGAEIVTETCGRLVAPGNSPALAGALAELVTEGEIRERLGGAGPARAAELCDPARQLPALADTLRKVIQ